jgi:putative membrane protein
MSDATSPVWQRLSAATLLVRAGWLVAPITSAALTALATNGHMTARAWITIAVITATFAVITGFGAIRWAGTRYRLTDNAFEMHWRIPVRQERTIPLRRIRYVDITANPLHRLLGLAVLRIATAGVADERGEVALDALPRATAEQLRQRLLSSGSAATDDETISALDIRWIRYAPLTFWVFGGVFVVAGSLYRAIDAMGLEPWRLAVVQDAFRQFGTSALWITIPLAVLAIAVIGSLGALVLYVENWWRYRLQWSDSRTLQITRGLLTTRRVAMERQRLRGVVLSEPLLLRVGGGAAVKAVAGGLGDREETRKRSGLLPPAPRGEALRVISRILSIKDSMTVELRMHPKVAQRRRFVRGLVWAVVPGSVSLAVLGWLLTPVLLHCAWIYALLSVVAAWWLARDAYRHLGHAFTDRHLFIRSGTFSRDTVALQRDGVLSWTFSSSPFGRRSDLVTVTAAVAAGEHGYRIPDLVAQHAVEFSHAAAPGILDEFVERA